jgi:serine/threonine protein kinase
VIRKTLAHYEITGQLGMGEVYRAKDQRLGRDVALEVLPPEFANDAERMARFQRKAQFLVLLHQPEYIFFNRGDFQD